MRFSVDAHAIGRHLTGNEVYIRNLLAQYARLDCESEFIAYISTSEASAWVPARFRTSRVSNNPFVRLGIDLARQLRRDLPDLVHVQYTAPLFCPVPVVVSVHDVSFLEHPEYFAPPRAAQLRYTVRRTIRRARRILTPSEFSRRSILRSYALDDDLVVVVPNGVSPGFRPLPQEGAAGWVRSRFGVRRPFILTVGDLQPRKNQIGLIRAFKALLRDCPQLDHDLVLVGKDTWYARRVRRAAVESGYRDRIHFTGFVSDDELLRLYAACDIFVFPSFYEGFGIPVLEAMACGRAVACSNTSAIIEVADAAAILFDPGSADSMARAMKDLLIDPELRARMERIGTQRAALFSWERAAAKTLEVYHSVAGDRSEAFARPARSTTAP